MLQSYRIKKYYICVCPKWFSSPTAYNAACALHALSEQIIRHRSQCYKSYTLVLLPANVPDAVPSYTPCTSKRARFELLVGECSISMIYRMRSYLLFESVSIGGHLGLLGVTNCQTFQTCDLFQRGSCLMRTDSSTLNSVVIKGNERGRYAPFYVWLLHNCFWLVTFESLYCTYSVRGIARVMSGTIQIIILTVDVRYRRIPTTVNCFKGLSKRWLY